MVDEVGGVVVISRNVRLYVELLLHNSQFDCAISIFPLFLIPLASPPSLSLFIFFWNFFDSIRSNKNDSSKCETDMTKSCRSQMALYREFCEFLRRARS